MRTGVLRRQVPLRVQPSNPTKRPPRAPQAGISDGSGAVDVDAGQVGNTATASISIIKSGRKSAATCIRVLVGGLATSM
jgi:hypothetical protein